MTEYRTPRQQREERANRILVAALTGLLVVVLVVIAFSSLTPARTVPTPASTHSASSAASSAPLSARLATSTAQPMHPSEPTAAKPKAAKPRVATSQIEPPVTAPAATPQPIEPKTTPEKMAHLPSSTRQIIVITGAKIGSSAGRLSLYNKEGDRWTEVMNVTANFGKNGLIDGAKRREGNPETPTGIWTIGSFLFGLHASAPSGTKMPYRPITKNSYWSSARDSTYNTWVNHKVSGEHLITSDPQYEYTFNTGYNSPPNQRVMGRGTAIFIHCFEPPGNSFGKYTHGCVAIAPSSMIRLFKALDPGRNPTCAIGTLKSGSSTSIWAY